MQSWLDSELVIYRPWADDFRWKNWKQQMSAFLRWTFCCLNGQCRKSACPSVESIVRSKNIHLFVSLKSNTFIDVPGKLPKRLLTTCRAKNNPLRLCTLKVASFIQFLLRYSHKFMAGDKSTKSYLRRQIGRSQSLANSKFIISSFLFMFYLFFRFTSHWSPPKKYFQASTVQCTT